MACFRCGRKSHFADSCYAKTSAGGKRLADKHDSSSYEDDDSSDGYVETYKYRKRAGKSASKRPRHTTRRSGVYVLKTSAGLHYVGKSSDIDARIQEHHSGSGASCLGGSSFQEVTRLLTSGSSEDLESWERNETLERMRTHGIENVRGWMFTETRLSDESCHDAFRQICEKYDLCRRCGRSSHFAGRCFARTVDSWAGDIPCL
jgi:predicted GIY-YIG superfamily endonuclease